MKKTLIAALLLLLVLPAVASAESETVTSGITTATLTWTPSEFGVTDAALTITRNGVVSFNQPIPDVVCAGCTLAGNGADDVKLVNLDGLDDDEVLVTAYSGGEHCCSLAGILRLQRRDGRVTTSSTRTSSRPDSTSTTSITTGGPRSSPRTFASRIGSRATWSRSRRPQVFIFVRQDDVPLLADVTTKYTTLIRRNAAEAKRSFAKARKNDPASRGVIAAYVADQYLLGHGSTG